MGDAPARASPPGERLSPALTSRPAAARLSVPRRGLPPPDALAADRAKALDLTPVSRETAERLDRFVALLLERQRTTNLIAYSTIPQVWTRHLSDSLQLLELAPDARTWVDVGSGAGFPGVVIACALAGKGATVHLVESNGKKAAFLQEAQHLTESPAVIHRVRMEEFVQTFAAGVDVVTARAVLPLKPLIKLTYPLLSKTGALALFPKGQNAERELANAAEWWSMKATAVVSRTDTAGRILVLREVAPRSARDPELAP
jgi:16S rRNA (guanine527-N7)-methyltransferase